MKRPRLGLALAAALLIPLLAGCSPEPGDADITGSLSPTSVLATSDIDLGATRMEALLDGELSLTNGCFTVVSQSVQSVQSVPIFPPSAEWDGVTLRWNGEEYRVGDEIALGGGQPGQERDLPAECAGLEEFLVTDGP